MRLRAVKAAADAQQLWIGKLTAAAACEKDGLMKGKFKALEARQADLEYRSIALQEKTATAWKAAEEAKIAAAAGRGGSSGPPPAKKRVPASEKRTGLTGHTWPKRAFDSSVKFNENDPRCFTGESVRALEWRKVHQLGD